MTLTTASTVASEVTVMATANTAASSKLDKAQSLGVPVLDEAGFTALLAGGPDAVRPAGTDDATDDAAEGEASA